MSGYTVSFSQGRVQSGEYDEIWTPRSPRKNRCGVVMCHGSGAPGEFIDELAQDSSVKLAAALASAGIPCIAGDFGNDAWGNSTVQSRITAAWGVLQTQFGVRSDKVCLLGVSMGGAAVTIYSQQHPSSVAAVVGLIPLVNLTAFYNANTSGAQAAIGTAWSTTPPAALPSMADNTGNASLAAGIPFLAGYSTVDTLITPSWVTAYAAAVGGTAIITDSTYGHSDAAVGGMPITTVGQFLSANGA